jgi:site-specific DNA-methyltransferase (adenine-specific)
VTAYWVTGSTLDVLRKIPDGTIDLVLSSPPFFALRSYLDPDDPAKGDEIGSEPTPGEFIDTLLDVTEECLRVLSPHGTLAFELGDTFAGSGGAGGDYGAGGLRDGQPTFKQGGKYGRVHDPAVGPPIRNFDTINRAGGPGFPLDKSLCLIPELYRMSLAYGFNPLTGRECTRWRVRNVVRWVRPNPPVGALGDKFRPATSEMVIACQSRTRYFDLDAVREKPKSGEAGEQLAPSRAVIGYQGMHTPQGHGEGSNQPHLVSHPAGAPPLDWWEIPTHGFTGSHYATWPPALCEKPIKAMSPAKVCTTCGEPSRRITSEIEPRQVNEVDAGKDRTQGRHVGGPFVKSHAVTPAVVETIGWTDCGHDTWRPGRILDPFAGSGTTLAVATGHSRDAIGIDLDSRNVDLAQQRVGMFLTECTIDELAEVLT